MIKLLPRTSSSHTPRPWFGTLNLLPSSREEEEETKMCGEEQEQNTTQAMENRKRQSRSQLSVMLAEENESSHLPDHRALRAAPHPCAPNLVWRERVSQWYYDVVDYLGEARDTVYIAMNVLDRYCVMLSASSTSFALGERDYEIAAMTALFLAIRVRGTATLELPQLMGMSRLGVRIQEILAIGKRMTESLSWERRLMTPLNFVQAMLNLLDVSPCLKSSLFESASYLVEVSVCDAFFSGMHSCKVAYAAVSNAIGTGPQSRLPHSQCVEFHRHISKLLDNSNDDDEIGMLRMRLHQIYAQSEENRNSAPHVIPQDDDDDEAMMVVVPPRSAFRVVSSQRLTSPSSDTTTSDAAGTTTTTGSAKELHPTPKDERSVSPSPATRRGAFK